MTKKELKEIVVKRFIFGDDYDNKDNHLQVVNLKIDKDLVKRYESLTYLDRVARLGIKECNDYFIGFYNNNKTHLDDDIVTTNCSSDKITFESEAIREKTIDSNTIQRTTYKQNVTVDISNIEDFVYVTMIYAETSSPIILVSDNPIYDFKGSIIPDIINTNKYYGTSFDFDIDINIETIKTKKFKGPMRSPKMLVEDIYTNSSIDKEKIEYDENGNVIKYSNQWNKISKVSKYIEDKEIIIDDTMFDGHIISRIIFQNGNLAYYYDIINEDMSNISSNSVSGSIIKYTNFDKLIQKSNTFVDKDDNIIISIEEDKYTKKYIFEGVDGMSIFMNVKASGFDSSSVKIRTTNGWYVDNDQDIKFDNNGQITEYKSTIYGNKVPDKIYIRDKYGVPVLSNFFKLKENKEDEEKK